MAGQRRKLSVYLSRSATLPLTDHAADSVAQLLLSFVPVKHISALLVMTLLVRWLILRTGQLGGRVLKHVLVLKLVHLVFHIHLMEKNFHSDVDFVE